MNLPQKIIAMCFMGLISAPIIAMAQTTSSDQASISVTISKGITVTKTGDLDFGAITINSGTVTINSKASKAGGFEVSGTAGATVDITLPQKVVLSDQSGHTVSFTPGMPIFNQQNSQSTANVFNSVLGGSATLNQQNGELYIWFGGSFDSNGLDPGMYSGVYTAKVEYASA